MVDDGTGESGGNELGETQQTALAALRAGRSFAQAAVEADVNRTTIYRWVQGDARFAAAYNAWKNEASASAQGRILKLADKAVDVVERALEKDNADVAVRLLVHLGAMKRPKAGRTDVDGVRVQMDQRDRERSFLDARKMTRYLLTKAGFTSADQRRYIRKHGYSGLAKQMMLDREEGLAKEARRLERAEKREAVTSVPDGPGEPGRFPAPGTDGFVAAVGPWFDAIERATTDATNPPVLHDQAELAASQGLDQQEVA